MALMKKRKKSERENAQKSARKSDWVLRVPARCDACDGCGRIWVLHRGAGIQTTAPCTACLGLGTVMKTIKLSTAESRRVDRMAHAHATDSG